MFYTAATYTCSYDEATKTAKWSKYGPNLSDCYLSLDYLIQQLYAGNVYGWIDNKYLYLYDGIISTFSCKRTSNNSCIYTLLQNSSK